MTMAYLGRSYDGHIEPCPVNNAVVAADNGDNIAASSCTSHHAHFSVPSNKVEQLLRDDAVSKRKNKEIAKRRLENKEQRKLPKIQEDNAKLDLFSRVLNSQKYSSVLSDYASIDYTFVDEFADRCVKFSQDTSLSKDERFAPFVVRDLLSYDELSHRVRKHCGLDTVDDVRRFAALLVNPPYSMKRRGSSRIRREGTMSFARLVASRIDDNMDLRNILRSIIFFGGRCCYCRVLLVRGGNDSETRATGEHLTPLSLQTSGTMQSNKKDHDFVHGSHRFGNIVLACDSCNVKRGSMPLVKWVATSSRIADNSRLDVMANIESFRVFAAYKEFSSGFSKLIDESVSALESVRAEQMNQLGEAYRYEDRTLLRILVTDYVVGLSKNPSKYVD